MSDCPTPLMHAVPLDDPLHAIRHGSLRLEQREVHVAVGIGVVLEHDAHRHADLRSGRAGSSRGSS